MPLGHLLVILLHALGGWAACGAIVGIGRRVTSMERTLVAHAIGAPVVFALVALLYFTRFDYTTPLSTAIIFISTAILMDLFVVALLVERSFEMFRSPLGTWLPLGGSFVVTYVVGLLVSGA